MHCEYQLLITDTVGWRDWLDAKCSLLDHPDIAGFDAYIVVYDSRIRKTYDDIEQVAHTLTSLNKPILLVSTLDFEVTTPQVPHSMGFYLAKAYEWEFWTVIWSDETHNDIPFKKITYQCSRTQRNDGWNYLKTNKVLGASYDMGGHGPRRSSDFEYVAQGIIIPREI